MSEPSGFRVTAGLVAFLRERLEEDEQTSRAAADDTCERWEASGEGVYGTTLNYPGAVVVGGYGHIGPAGTHIARYDPARVLAEVDAKRRIIDAHPITTSAINPGYGKTGAGFGCETCHDWDGTTEGYGYCQTIKLLALPYVGHPDYCEEWRP